MNTGELNDYIGEVLVALSELELPIQTLEKCMMRMVGENEGETSLVKFALRVNTIRKAGKAYELLLAELQDDLLTLPDDMQII